MESNEFIGLLNGINELYPHFVIVNVMTCQSLGRNILALELDMKDFLEVIEPFIVVDMLNLVSDHIHNFDIDCPLKKCSNKKMFECE